jgi:hypothetical protein
VLFTGVFGCEEAPLISPTARPITVQTAVRGQ